MNQLEIIKCADATEAVQKASAKLNSILENLHTSGVSVLLLMSGGSALKIADYIEKKYLPHKLALGVLDDRYSQDEKVNNFAQLMQTKLYTDAASSGALFIDTRVEGEESMDSVASRADLKIKNWLAENPTGKVVITQGVGPDGHTSGMMPYLEDEKKFKKLFVETDKYSVGYDAEGKNQYSLRITATMRFLMDRVDESVLLMTGLEKTEALKKAMDASGSLASTPARVINQMQKVSLFTDINY